MARSFGVSIAGGTVSGVVVNSFTENESVEIAEARDASGKVTDLKAYSTNSTISVSGVVDGSVCAAGGTIAVGSSTYLIDSVNKSETNTGFAQATINGKKADNATLSPLGSAE